MGILKDLQDELAYLKQANQNLMAEWSDLSKFVAELDRQLLAYREDVKTNIARADAAEANASQLLIDKASLTRDVANERADLNAFIDNCRQELKSEKAYHKHWQDYVYRLESQVQDARKALEELK